MENKDLKIAILNLTGELQSELREYFAQREIKVVDPLTSQEKLEWTHVLTKDIHDFNLIRSTYQTIERDVKIISLTRVQDPQNFFVANGRLVLDELWLKGPLGGFILDKFFQEYAGINLGDNYPKFEEKGSFNVTNPFSTGEYLDRLVHHAFAENFAGLSVKTYFDHILMYLTGLKNKGRVGLPIEVTYGNFDGIFGLQLHFYADGILLEDITGSLSGNLSKRAEEHLLTVAVRSADFFDFTYLAEVKKVVATALWTQDERISIENQGMMFTNLTTAATIQQLPYEGATSQLLESGPVADLSEKVKLPEKTSDEENGTVSGKDLSEALAEKISGELEIEQVKQILSGGLPDEDPDKIVVGSTNELDDLINLVKGGVEEEASVMRVKGGKLDVDNFAMRISAGIQEKAPGTMNVISLGEKLPEKIKTGLFDFAKGLGKGVDDLDEKDIHIFKTDQVPNIIKNHSKVGSTLSQKLREELKQKLEEGIKSEFHKDSALSALDDLKSPEDEERLKELLKSTLKTSLDENFKLTEKENISEVEKDLLVKSLSVSLEEDENKIRQIVSSEKKGEEKPLFKAPPSEAEKELQKQLQTALVENDKMKGKLKTMMLEVKILKESRQQIANMSAQAKQAANAAEVKSLGSAKDDELRKHFQQRLSQEQTLNHEEQQKLKQLMERESKLMEAIKEKEMEARKGQIEASQKETLLTQEIEKINRQSKAKDLVITKTKETLSKMMEKHQGEIESLQMKIDTLSLALNSGPSQVQVTQVKDLEKQNQNLAKMVEMYKAKVAGMMTQMQASKDDGGSSKEEVRKLQMINMQLKNQVEAANKEVQKFKDKAAYDMNQAQAFRAEKAKLDQQIKQLTQDLRKVQAAPVNNEVEVELKKALAQAHHFENQIKDLTIKLKESETRLADALKNPQKQAGGNTDDKKILLLENNVKKVTADLMEARNQAAEMKKETTKLRQEKTALQNQIDKLKKDLEKATKTATPKKPDGGGKAA